MDLMTIKLLLSPIIPLENIQNICNTEQSLGSEDFLKYILFSKNALHLSKVTVNTQ